MIKIKKVTQEIEISIIEKLAGEILHEVYDSIIPPEHTDYFLERFQSVSAIKNQIENKNFNYYLLKYNNQNVGYLGIQQSTQILNLSKLYILKSYRGKKIGKIALEFVNEFALTNGMQRIELIVNRQNQNTIEIYQKKGFKVVESIVNSFPNGYNIEDYRMEKVLGEVSGK